MISYLDAGTGSMIVTAVAGGFAGIAVAGKMGMRRLKAKLSGKSAEDTADDSSGDASSEADA